MSLKAWHKVMDPRADIRAHKPQDAAEFAVQLDLVRDNQAPDEYNIPDVFFQRTFLTKNLTQLAVEVFGRLSGEVHGANAVFNLTTQFGGGKTHALTLLYHLAKHGPDSHGWFGVDRVRREAQITAIPRAAIAVFVGTEFDSLSGRGGKDGTPLRKTPWGEIAYQLRGEEGFNLVAEHEQRMIAPAGDVLRELLPEDQPCLILVDELINYTSRYRHTQGLAAQLYNFIQNLSEAVRSRSKAALVISLPKSSNEMSSEDESDYAGYLKLLSRVSKPFAIASETEVSEIIRRRLFEWDSKQVDSEGRMILDRDAKAVCKAYADWVVQNKRFLSPDFAYDNAQREFELAYPFHPAVISLFQRKWRTLPQFQQTRGILRLLAQWVSETFQGNYLKANQDLLIGLGTAPLEESSFRVVIADQQLNNDRLKAVITTDITGKDDAHARYLDRQAGGETAKRRLHTKIATALFFESNGGQMDARASLAEIRLAVGEPDLEVLDIEPALERLIDACYYLAAQGQKYHFSVRPNLNKLLADRRATLSGLSVEECVHDDIRAAFEAKGSPPNLSKKFFPTLSTDVPDLPQLTLTVIAPEITYATDEGNYVQRLMKKVTLEYGEKYRTYKSALIWCVADSTYTPALYNEARKLLALEAIEQDDSDTLDDAQIKQISAAKDRAKRDLREAVWRSYCHVLLLDKENNLREMDLGLVHSSSAQTLSGYLLRELTQAGEVVETIGVNYLLRNWPAQKEWSTKAVREVVFGSPRFPRLLGQSSLRNTIVQGVENGQIAYVGKKDGEYEPFYHKMNLNVNEIDFSDEMFLISGETAEVYLAAKKAAETTPEAVQPSQPGISEGIPVVASAPSGNGALSRIQEEHTSYQTHSTQPEQVAGDGAGVRKLTWRGEIPILKWNLFYMKVLTRFATGGGLKLTVQMDLAPEGGISRQKIDETRIALRDLGLSEDGLIEE